MLHILLLCDLLAPTHPAPADVQAEGLGQGLIFFIYIKKYYIKKPWALKSTKCKNEWPCLFFTAFFIIHNVNTDSVLYFWMNKLLKNLPFFFAFFFFALFLLNRSLFSEQRSAMNSLALPLEAQYPVLLIFSLGLIENCSPNLGELWLQEQWVKNIFTKLSRAPPFFGCSLHKLIFWNN